MNGVPGVRVRAARCSDCVYRVAYPKATRDALFAAIDEQEGFVSCHQHDDTACVICRGYWDAVADNSPSQAVQLAVRFHRAGLLEPEWVVDGQYEREDDDG